MVNQRSINSTSANPHEPDALEPRRILVVRDAKLSRRVEEAVANSQAQASPVKVATTSSFLAAMGDLAQQPADAVIGPIEALSGMIGATAKALRELAPEARLVVTAEAPSSAESLEALEAGFDLMLIEPISDPDLVEAIFAAQPRQKPALSPASFEGDTRSLLWREIDAHVDALTPVGQAAHDTREAPEHTHAGVDELGQSLDEPSGEPPSSRSSQVDEAVGPHTPTTPDTSDASDASDALNANGSAVWAKSATSTTSTASAPAVDSSTISAPGPQGSTANAAAQPTLAAEDLGDVDLIDALLLDHAPLNVQAMRIIEAQSQIEGIGWIPATAQGSPSAQSKRSEPSDHSKQTDPDAPERAETSMPPPEHLSAPIVYHDQNFGQLHAPPPIEADQLQAWADWLARWLALASQFDQLKTLAMRDDLTGVWNRRYLNRFLSRILQRARRERQQVTVMVFDIDDFKQYNDRFGHGAGDEILRETARLMQSVVRDHDVVARIGGDEFAVIFWDAQQPRREGSVHPHDVMRAAQRFRQAIGAHRFPKLAEQAHGTLTVSAGLAGYPWDGQRPSQLLELADAMAMQSKRQGKNVITYGPGAARICRAGGLDPNQSETFHADRESPGDTA